MATACASWARTVTTAPSTAKADRVEQHVLPVLRVGVTENATRRKRVLTAQTAHRASAVATAPARAVRTTPTVPLTVRHRYAAMESVKIMRTTATVQPTVRHSPVVRRMTSVQRTAIAARRSAVEGNAGNANP